MAGEPLPFHSLFLLSPAPSPASYSNIKAAYHAALVTVLREISRTSQQPSNGKKILDIALPCPHLYRQEQTQRAALYDQTQKLLSSLYKLITVISASQNINVEDDDGIDARILLVAFPRDGKLDAITPPGTAGADLTGPVVTIHTLANSRRPWSTIYAIETEQGEQVLKLFQQSGKAYTNVQRVRGGVALVNDTSADRSSAISTSSSSQQKHYGIAVGGTFDHLHIGHKLLLTMFAFMADNAPSDTELGSEPPRTLTCGITAGELLKNKKYAEFLESWDERQKATWGFLSAVMNFSRSGDGAVSVEEIHNEGANGHAVHYRLPSGLIAKMVEIWDPFGPTITDESIDTLVISAETRSGGKAVNDKRKEKGWTGLDVYEVDVLDAEDKGDSSKEAQEDAKQQFESKLSSTEIRKAQSEKRSKRVSKV